MSERTDVFCYYHAPLKAPLLRDAVLPALTLAGGSGVESHLERHWRYGPHVRVCLSGPRDVVPDVATRIAARLRDYLAVAPSTAGISEADLLAQALAAGRAELVPPPYTPIHADNTVRIEEPDPAALDDLLGPGGAACRVRLLRNGVPAVASTLDFLAERGDSSAARVWMAMVAMSSHAARYPLGLGNGYHSFLSHLEDFLLHHDRNGALRSRFAAQWDRHAEATTELVVRIAGGTTTSAAEAAWAQWSNAAWTVLEPAYDRDELPKVPGPAYSDRAGAIGDTDTIRRWDPDQRTEFSPYHQLLRGVDFVQLPYEREFVVYRFATNALYLLLGLCDVHPAERYLAAYLFSHAVERITGLPWREALTRLAASAPAAPQVRAS